MAFIVVVIQKRFLITPQEHFVKTLSCIKIFLLKVVSK